jgi:hypothetical protein
MDTGVPAVGFAAFRNTISSPTLRAIADHWHEARGDRPMPSWSQIRPSSIAPYLTWIWSFRYDRDSDEFTARLAGNHITIGFGKNFRGTRLEDIHHPPALGRVKVGLRRLLLTPSLYRSTGRLFRQGDHTGEGERIALPLAGDGLHGDGVLGASDYGPIPASVAGEPVEVLQDIEEWFALDR